MIDKGLRKLFWGFFFTLIGFNIQGFDIFPDVVGYIIFAFALKDLEEYSGFFREAFKYNGYLIIISALTTFSFLFKTDNALSPAALVSIIIAIISLVLDLKMIHRVFLGLKEMHERHSFFELASGADERWEKYKQLIILAFLIVLIAFIPVINLLYIIAVLIISIIFIIKTLKYINSCRDAYGRY